MHELLTQFGIDWKLLLAQIINFAILLYILKHFAYGPVMNMLDERKQKIEEGIRESELSHEKLARAHEHEKEILHKAHTDALGIVERAEHDADEHSKNILEAAHAKSEQVIASGQKRLQEEQGKMVQEFEAHAHDLVALSLIKVIGKLEPAERSKKLIQEALHELKVVSKTS